MTCSHCGNAAHLDFEDKTTRCNPCHRTEAWCRCAPVKAERTPNWLTASRERRYGLAKELVA